MKHYPFTTPTVLKQSYARANSGRKLEALFSAVILLGCIFFWYWLVQQPYFALGVVESVSSVSEEQAVAQVSNPAKLDFIYEYEDTLQSMQEQWVFAYGERIGDISPQLLYPDQIESVQMFLQVLVWPVKAWLQDIAESKYLAILLAGLLLLISGHAFRYAYSAAVIAFVCFTAWHGMYAAKWLGLFSFDEIGLGAVLLVCAGISLHWCMTHGHFAFVESLMAMLIWIVLGKAVLAEFGVDSELWQLLVFGVALVCPSVITAFLAAYLFSQAFEASALGANILLLLCIVISVTQMFGTQATRQYASQLILMIPRRFIKKKYPWPKGKVSVHTFLKTPS